MSDVFSERIKYLRTCKGSTQKEIAEYCGVATSTIQRLEYDELKPNMKLLVNLADYYEVSTDYLLGRTDNLQGSKYI